jgi:hypothetical protein
MRSLLDQLFQLKHLSSGGEGVELRFAHALPAWAWVFIALACVLFASWSYWKLLGRKPARVALALMRSLLLAMVCVLIAGPELVKQNDQVERDWVVVMADRSASMTVADAPSPTGAATRITREQQLNGTMRTGWPTFAALAQKRNVLFLGFDSGVFDLRTVNDGPNASPTGIDLGRPEGQRTLIGQALEQTLRRVAARPVAGIVMISDGRSADAPGRPVLRQLESRQIPVYTVALGSPTPLMDLAVGRVDAPSAAFVGDLVPVSVDVERLGGTGASIRGKVQLVDDATDAVLDERPLEEPAQPNATDHVTLTAHPEQAGAATWSVRLVLDTPDLTSANNRAPVRLDLVDRPIRVVYFDGYPRWEYRYLKNLLVREKSIKSSTLLLASDRRYLQEGSDPLDALPRTQAGWNPFDVVIMGDLRPGLFSDEQLAQIKSLIAERGAGLLWIGGSAATPGAWRGTVMADLLPFTVAQGSDGGSGGPATWLDPVVIRPGPGAARYGVLQLGEDPHEPWPAMLSAADLGWNTLRWAQRIEPATLKPTAEVLALAAPTTNAGGSSSAPTPLVMTMRYGAGRVVYVATDETWRYRYARGETLTERFWIPIIRLLARESLGRSGKPAVIQASPERAQVGQQVQVSVHLLDQSFAERRPESIKVKLVPEPTANSGRVGNPIELTLKPESPTQEGSPSSLFTAVWLAGEPGPYHIEPADPLLSGLDLRARLEVALPEDELRLPQSDHAALASLSQATGGKVLEASQLAELPSLLPNRELHLLGTPDIETLWDKPVVWVFLMLLLTLEWVGRRVIKLS